MNGTSNNSNGTKKPHGGLRLVTSERAPDAPQTAAAEAELAPRPKSRLAQLLTAYADAIDRDVALILDL